MPRQFDDDAFTDPNSGRTLEGHEALSAELNDLSAEMQAKDELIRLCLALLKRCREESMPYFLRREIDEALKQGSDYT